MRFRIDNDYFTVKEVAHLLKLSELTIYKYIREEKLQAYEFGRHFRIEKISLKKFIESHKVKTDQLRKGGIYE